MNEVKLGAKIVVIGGGTGSFTLLSGLKHYASDITALVNMSDDGGSTGQLRDELGVLPPGDVRQCLVALSNSPTTRDLFNYRFDEGSLKGHAFGNLFLTALQKMTGSFAQGVELASEVLNIAGRVEPITFAPVQLCAKDQKGKTVCGQHAVTDARLGKRPELWLEPAVMVQPEAVTAIMEADMVVIAPGNLYASLVPTLLVQGVADALRHTKAKIVCVTNLVTKPGQTDGFTVADYASEIERFTGEGVLDYVVYNTEQPSEHLMSRYAHDGEFAVTYDESELKRQHYKAKGAPLLAKHAWTGAQEGDPLAHQRTFIRHDSDQLARQLMKIYFS